MRRLRGSRWARRAAGVLALSVVAFLGASLYVERRYADRIVSLAAAPPAPVAVVFGAGLAPGKEPSRILAERLDAAVALYRAGKVKTLLVTGDNSDRFHDETSAMRRYVLQRGLPASAVVGDDLGLSTYDSCVRAREVFGVEAAVLVTQRFHLPRALFICNSVGVYAHGVAADEGRARGSAYALRELVSRPVALAMVLFGAPAEERAPRTE